MNAQEQYYVFVSDVVFIVVFCLVECLIGWCYILQVKSEMTALRLVPCFARAGHICHPFHHLNFALTWSDGKGLLSNDDIIMQKPTC